MEDIAREVRVFAGFRFIVLAQHSTCHACLREKRQRTTIWRIGRENEKLSDCVGPLDVGLVCRAVYSSSSKGGMAAVAAGDMCGGGGIYRQEEEGRLWVQTLF
jgi:hypothetical protein